MSHAQIVRLSQGFINQINDPIIGMSAVPMGPGVSKFAGQLGAWFWLDDAQVIYTSSVGTVLGGRFRYVRLSAAAGAVAVGQTVFWDTSVADNLYQVTTSETITGDAAVNPAGIVLYNGWTAGNYSVIQDAGPATVKFRAALTSVGAIGSPVYTAGVGGADLGLADVINTAGAATKGDIGLLLRRYLGTARTAPVNGGSAVVDLNFHNIRG